MTPSPSINDQYRWEADITASRLGSTQSSGGVVGSEATPAEYYYSTRFTASSYFKQGDVNILGLYYADGATYNMTTLSANSRIPFGNGWHISPRLQLGLRHQSMTGDKEYITGAGLRVEYELYKTMTFELDCSSDWTETETMLSQQKRETFFVSAGYRWMF